MIVMYEKDNNIIRVSQNYIKEALVIYLKNSLIETNLDSIIISKNMYEKSSDYSVILILDQKKYNFNYQKLESLVKNVRNYLYKNFNLSCIFSVGI